MVCYHFVSDIVYLADICILNNYLILSFFIVSLTKHTIQFNYTSNLCIYTYTNIQKHTHIYCCYSIFLFLVKETTLIGVGTYQSI